MKNIDYLGILKYLAERFLNHDALAQFTELDMQSQILGLKVFAFIAQNFALLKQLESIEDHITLFTPKGE